jgi:protein involved in polysaccharide export with SLBB domain
VRGFLVKVLKVPRREGRKIREAMIFNTRGSMSVFPVSKSRLSVVTALLLGLSTVIASAQQLQPPQAKDQAPQYDRTKAVPDAYSRAEAEADRLVSLSADKIISLLAQEPGLLLVCKKVLVRTAYAQGRVMDPDELTDEAVFRQIRNDQAIRVLFTREIEDRYYVRAKPTKEELEKDYELGRTKVPDPAVAQLLGTGDLKNVANQEDAYWMRHERDIDKSNLPGANNSSNSSGNGGVNQAMPPDMLPGPYQPQQQLLRTQQDTDYDSMPDGGFGLSNLGSDQMSMLMSASLGGGAGLGAGGGGGEDSAGAGSALTRGLGSNGMMGGDGMGMSPLDALSMGGGLGMPGTSDGMAGTTMSPYANQMYGMPGQGYYNSYRRRYPPQRPRQPMLQHRPDPYADVPSLYDLYTQYPRKNPKLDRFGMDIFTSGTSNFDRLPMDMPVGPDYVLGPGDNLNINLVGGVSQRLRRVVDLQGQVSLPEVGPVEVSGKTLGEVQQLVQASLRSEYRMVQADVSLGKVRSVRVYVVGDVRAAGPYEVSALSTPLNAVYEAGGPSSAGSLRILNHYRGKRLIQRIDVYDLLLHGVNGDMQRLQAGDTIQVPPLGAEVTVSGMVRRPAIYELNGETDLAQVLETAGGVLPTGTLRHVDVERIEAHESVTMLRLDIPEGNNQDSVRTALEDFKVQDGDKIQISPILPYADKTVYLDGHVFRPGKFAYRDGMKVTDLIKSYKDLMPEPYKEHAEIIRLKMPDDTPEVITFRLDEALAGQAGQDLTLQPFDTVRIFGRYDFEDPPLVTVSGEVRDPGDHVTNGAIHFRDAIYLAGGFTPNAAMDDAQIFRKTQDGKLEVINVNISRVMAADSGSDVELMPNDRVFVHKDMNKTDPPTVMVEGEVGRPGKYPLTDGMTASSLVRLAGGLKRSAYTDEADLTSYMVQDGSKVVSDHRTVEIAKAMAGEPDVDVRLHDGDVLAIRQLSGWNDLGATIKVSGEVVHPGTYGIQEGERLSSVIARAGGLRADAYPYGAVFQRGTVRDLQEDNRSDLIRRVKSEAADAKLVPTQQGEDPTDRNAAIEQYQITLQRLENTPPSGRMVIHISSDVSKWANTSADITVRDGDEILIPKKPSIVIVTGSVYNPTAISFKPGKNTEWYLKQAGGPNESANKKNVFVVRADGSVIGGPGGVLSGGVDKQVLQAGDMVVVPEKIYAVSHAWQNTAMTAQIVTAVAIAVTAAKTF